MTVQPLILAAGKGKRMKSEVPKPMIPILGKPMIQHLLASVDACGFTLPAAIVVAPDSPLPALLGSPYRYIVQSEFLGTGHATSCAKEALQGKSDFVLVICGDQPWVSTDILQNLVKESERHQASITMGVVKVPHFDGPYAIFKDFGKIIRNVQGDLKSIVELKDATLRERAITEINPSVYCFNASWLWKNIGKLQPNNVQHEYYLTDLIRIALQGHHNVTTVLFQDPFEAVGINTQEQLKMAEELLRHKKDR